MTHQTLRPSPRLALVSTIDLSAPGLGQEQVFYYDGAYLTWSQLERRFQSNTSTAA